MHLTTKQLEYLDSLLRAYFHANDVDELVHAERELNKFGISIDYEENVP
jgi:hypothetical protein